MILFPRMYSSSGQMDSEILFLQGVAGGTILTIPESSLSRLSKLRLPMRVLGGMSGAQGCKDLLIQTPGLKLHGQPLADLLSNIDNTSD